MVVKEARKMQLPQVIEVKGIRVLTSKQLAEAGESEKWDSTHHYINRKDQRG